MLRILKLLTELEIWISNKIRILDTFWLLSLAQPSPSLDLEYANSVSHQLETRDNLDIMGSLLY